MGMELLRQRVWPGMWRRSGGGCVLLPMRQATWPAPCSSALGCWGLSRCAAAQQQSHVLDLLSVPLSSCPEFLSSIMPS